MAAALVLRKIFLNNGYHTYDSLFNAHLAQKRLWGNKYLYISAAMNLELVLTTELSINTESNKCVEVTKLREV